MKSRLLTLPAVPAAPILSRWRSLIKDTIQCRAEPMVSGSETLRNMVAAIRTANAPDHYIYILGWMLDVDFCLIAGDLSTKLKYLLKEAVDKGVEVRALIWGNPTYIKTDETAMDAINDLTSTKGGSAHMALDNNTFGSDTVKNAIVKVKSVIASLPSPVTGLLSHVGAWKDLNDTLDLVKNEGSHHEKILVVKGSEGMIGFAGGIDINSNRVDGLKGMCCGTINPDTGLPYYPDHLCDADVSIFGIRSNVLRDVSCKVRDEGAWKLLQQFIRRWESYKVNPRFSWLPDLDLDRPLRGASEPKPVSPASPTNSNIKVLHTFNKPLKMPKRKFISKISI
jgi:phosphatidylserine/phosphatidylglycerophosphate/cardiolipin synthase-like enzyme